MGQGWGCKQDAPVVIGWQATHRDPVGPGAQLGCGQAPTIKQLNKRSFKGARVYKAHNSGLQSGEAEAGIWSNWSYPQLGAENEYKDACAQFAFLGSVEFRPTSVNIIIVPQGHPP